MLALNVVTPPASGRRAPPVLITLAAIWNWTPLFFEPGRGGTLTRQLVLGSAITMFVLAALRSSHGFWLLGIPLEQAAAVRIFFLHDLGATFSYVTFIPAVILAAFMGGYGPGLMTALLSTLLVLFFWTEPVGWHIFHPSSDMAVKVNKG